MELTINGEAKTLAVAMTVEALVAHLGLAHERVAVEVNRKLVRRAAWHEVALADGDVVEIVQFVGGGS